MSSFPNDPIDCVVCPGHVSRVQAVVDVAVGKRESVSVAGLFARCDRCGEVYFAPGEMDAVHRHATDIIREREGLLRPDEIRAIRDGLGLTQAGLERLIRVGPKTVVRWERGTTFQNRSTDTLLRALRDVPGLADYLSSDGAIAPAEQHTTLVTLEFPTVLANVTRSTEALSAENEQSTSVSSGADDASSDWALVAA